MGLAATTIFEVRTTGSDSNGGGFNPALGGTDYSQQDAAQATGTVSSSGTTVTATSGIFTAAMVGNLITDGSVWKEITAFTSSTVVTVDSAPSWTSASIRVGGALATPQAAPLFSNFTMYILGGTYSGSTWAIHVSGRVFGRGSSRTDVTAKPTLSFAVSFTYDGTEGNPVLTLSRFTISGTVTLSEATQAEFVDATKFTGGNNPIHLLACWATCFETSAGKINASDCVALGGGGTYGRGWDIQTASFVSLHECYAINCSSQGFNLYQSAGISMVNCGAYGCTNSGVRLESTTENIHIANCISEGNGGYGFEQNTASNHTRLVNCSGYNNTSGNYSANFVNVEGFVASSVSAFTNAAGSDFSPASGGDARAASWPSSFPGLSTSNYRDRGPAQHQDSGGGGGVIIVEDD